MNRHVVAEIVFAAALAASLAPGVALPAAASSPTPAPSPAPVPALDEHVTYRYATTISLDTGGPVPRAGRFDGPAAADELPGALHLGPGVLELTFNADGSINGTYRPDVGTLIGITGARTGPNDLWISIGSSHFTGHFTRSGITLMCPVPLRPMRTMQLAGTFVPPNRVASPVP